MLDGGNSSPLPTSNTRGDIHEDREAGRGDGSTTGSTPHRSARWYLTDQVKVGACPI